MENQNNATLEMVQADGGQNWAGKLQEVGKTFSTFPTDTQEQKAALFNITNGESKLLSDMVNIPIEFKYLHLETITRVKTVDKTPVLDAFGDEIIEEVPLCTIITPDFQAYYSTSSIMFDSIRKLCGAFGMPDTWEKPLTVKVVNRGENGRLMYKLEIVDTKKK